MCVCVVCSVCVGVEEQYAVFDLRGQTRIKYSDIGFQVVTAPAIQIEWSHIRINSVYACHLGVQAPLPNFIYFNPWQLWNGFFFFFFGLKVRNNVVISFERHGCLSFLFFVFFLFLAGLHSISHEHKRKKCNSVCLVSKKTLLSTETLGTSF